MGSAEAQVMCSKLPAEVGTTFPKNLQQTPDPPITSAVRTRSTRPSGGLDWSDDDDVERVHPNGKIGDLVVMEPLKVSTTVLTL